VPSSAHVPGSGTTLLGATPPDTADAVCGPTLGMETLMVANVLGASPSGFRTG
jgi:hypothetical protein